MSLHNTLRLTATHYDSLQHITTHCNTLKTLQYTAIHSKTQQHTATHCNTLHPLIYNLHTTHSNTQQHTATHCNILQHTATHCNTLHPTESHYNTLQHTEPHCNTPHHTATHCDTLCIHSSTLYCSVLQRVAVCYSVLQHPLINNPQSLQHTAAHCNTLQHTATHCYTLQQSTAHCNSLLRRTDREKRVVSEGGVDVVMGVPGLVCSPKPHIPTPMGWLRIVGPLKL